MHSWQRAVGCSGVKGKGCKTFRCKTERHRKTQVRLAIAACPHLRLAALWTPRKSQCVIGGLMSSWGWLKAITGNQRSVNTVWVRCTAQLACQGLVEVAWCV